MTAKERFINIFLSFLEANIRKFFWGSLVITVCIVFYMMKEPKLTIGGLSGLLGYAMSQLKVNMPLIKPPEEPK